MWIMIKDQIIKQLVIYDNFVRLSNSKRKNLLEKLIYKEQIIVDEQRTKNKEQRTKNKV